MDSGDKKTVWVVGIIAVLIFCLTGAILIFVDHRTKRFVDAGYTRKMLIGHDFAQWVKEDASTSSIP